MTRLWTALVPRDGDPARTLLIEDRWRWGAFLFGPFWALWNGHWLAAPGLLLVGGALGAAGTLQPEAAAAAQIGLSLATGFEGAALARLDRRLRGWREIGAVDALDEDEAEWRWFAGRAAAPAEGPWG
jgi:hypothetical protein